MTWLSDKFPSADGRNERRHGDAEYWFSVIRSEDASEDDLIYFADWLAADPSHAEALADVEATWDILENAKNHYSKIEILTVDGKRGINRWRLTAGISTMAAAALAIALTIGPSDEIKTYKTTNSEHMEITPSDGSSFFLDPLTSVSVDFSEIDRKILLSQGKAYFDLVDDDRRFHLVSQGYTMGGFQSRFLVESGKGWQRVSILDGSLIFQNNVNPGLSEFLIGAGQAVTMVNGAITSVSRLPPGFGHERDKPSRNSGTISS